MILFTHLKIILLQYFSVFSFQFSVITKRTFKYRGVGEFLNLKKREGNP